MKAARFSLAALLLWMAMIAVGCQALVSHTPWWASAVLTATLALFGLALLMLLAGSGSQRVGLLGFALSGAMYLSLTLYPQLYSVGEQLLTTRALMLLWPVVAEPAPQSGQVTLQPTRGSSVAWGTPDAAEYEFIMSAPAMGAISFGQNVDPTQRSYLLVGQCLWSVLLAFPAGLFCAWLYERRLRREQRGSQAPTRQARPSDAAGPLDPPG